MNEEPPWSPPTLGRPPRPLHAPRSPSPPPPRRGRSLTIVLGLILIAAVGAVAAVVLMGGDDASPTPDTGLPPPPAPGGSASSPPVSSGDQLRRPAPAADAYTEPVPCDGFSPDGLAQLGLDARTSEPVVRSSGETAITCTFPGGVGAVVMTSTYPASSAGDGAAAVWGQLEEGFASSEGIADLADGALFDPGACRLSVAHSNALLVLMGNLTHDPAGCRAQLVPLAQDFAAETFS